MDKSIIMINVMHFVLRYIYVQRNSYCRCTGTTLLTQSLCIVYILSCINMTLVFNVVDRQQQ